MKRSELTQIIREEIKKVLKESAPKFSADKMRKLIEKDKFLEWEYNKNKNKYKNREKEYLEYLFNEFVLGDPSLEKEYNKVK